MAERPARIQRKRTKGWRMPEGSVVVMRPTEWGNPWRVTVAREHKTGKMVYFVDTGERASSTHMFDDRADAVSAAVTLFRCWAEHPRNETWRERARLALRGKRLVCGCPLDQPCHADVLLELVNAD